MTQVQLPSGEYVNTDSKGNIINPDGSIFTGGGASVPSVDPYEDQSLMSRYGEDYLNKHANDPVSSPSASIPSRQAGESAQDYATRILNSPFFLAGGSNSSGQSAYVYDPGSNSYVTRSASSINRPITSAPKQNYLTSDSSASTGIDYRSFLGLDNNGVQKSAQDYLDTFTPPETRQQILDRKTKEAGNLIQSNNDYYTNLLTETSKANDQRSREANAEAVLRGLGGSTEAGRISEVATEKNRQATTKVLAEKNLALQNIYKDIQASAEQEFNNQQTDAYKKATDIVARNEKTRATAVANITTLAKSGFDFSSIKNNDPVTYVHLAQSVGGEAQLQAIATLNRPQEDIIDKKVENGKYIIAYRNPLTGNTRIESVDLGLPPQYTKTIEAGDRIIAIPDNWDGTTVNQGEPVKSGQGISISKGLTPNQAQNQSKKNTPSTNKITLAEAKANGFPKYVVGMSEAEISQSLYEASPPQWFLAKVSEETQQTPKPDVLKQAWDAFRKQILNTENGENTNSGGNNQSTENGENTNSGGNNQSKDIINPF